MFLFFSMVLLRSFFRWIKRIIPIEKWFNLLRHNPFFFPLKMTKIWVCRTMLNGEKKEDGLMNLPECDWHGPLPLGKVSMYIQLLAQ